MHTENMILRNEQNLVDRWSVRDSIFLDLKNAIIAKTSWRGISLHEFSISFIASINGNVSDIDLRGCKFKNVDFSGVDANEVSFERCTFFKCNFAQSMLENAYFINCDFSKCNLVSASFRGSLILNSRFDHCNIRECAFGGAAICDVGFDGCDISSVDDFLIDYKDIGQMDFSSIVPAFRSREVRKRSLLFTHFYLSVICLVDKFFRLERNMPSERVLLDEYFGDWSSSEKIYSQLYVYFRSNGLIDEAKKTHYLRRRISLLSSKFPSFNHVSWFFTGFGVSIRKILMSSAAFISVFAYYYSGNEYFTFLEKGSNLEESSRLTLTFSEALYFSSVTFATLGYGDISPDKSLVRQCAEVSENVIGSLWCARHLLLPTIEALCGAIFIALIAVALVRNMLRE